MSKLDSLIEAALLREDEALLRIADAAEDHTFSPAFEKAVEAKIRSGRKGTPPVLRRVVALVAVATLLVGSAFAFWDELIGLFVTAFPQYAELRIAPNIVPNEAFLTFPANWTELWIPEYMADGYTYLDATQKQSGKQLSFVSSSEKYITFSQFQNHNATLGDNEGNSVPNIFISSYEANAFEKLVNGDTLRRVVWSDGTNYFGLSGYVSFDELTKIGNSIILCEIGE